MHTLRPRQSMSRLETSILLTNDLDRVSPYCLFLELVKPKTHGSPHYSLQLAATNHTVIVFDNRGIGETTVGTKPFSIEQFANDTAGLLDALQIEKADVLGASLGSFIAQELTLNYPQKVDRLILHAGYCGGNEAVYASGQALETIMTLSSPQILRNMTAEEQAMILAQIMFPPEWLEATSRDFEYCN